MHDRWTRSAGGAPGGRGGRGTPPSREGSTACRYTPRASVRAGGRRTGRRARPGASPAADRGIGMRLLLLPEPFAAPQASNPPTSMSNITHYTRLLLDPHAVNATATTATLTPGRPRKHHRNPLLTDKFRALAHPVLGSDRATRIETAVNGLEHIELSELTNQLLKPTDQH